MSYMCLGSPPRSILCFGMTLRSRPFFKFFRRKNDKPAFDFRGQNTNSSRVKLIYTFLVRADSSAFGDHIQSEHAPAALPQPGGRRADQNHQPEASEHNTQSPFHPPSLPAPSPSSSSPSPSPTTSLLPPF